MEQFQTWLTCQRCGRAAPRNVSEGWLDQPHKHYVGIRVVRCPQHWSDWALRNTKEGRTRHNRDRMAEALAMPAPVIPIHLQPYPTREQEGGKNGGEQATYQAATVLGQEEVRGQGDSGS